jgi:hypothetical protein
MNEHDARVYSAGFFAGISREQPKTGESRRTLSDKISRYTLKPCDGKGLLDLCERIWTRVVRETKKRVEMCSESSCLTSR